MSVHIFFLAFSSIVLYFFEITRSKNAGIWTRIRLSFVYALVLAAFISYFFCEILSIFNVLDLAHLIVGWTLIFILFASLLIKSGLKFEQSFPHLPRTYLVYTFAIFIFILLPLLSLVQERNRKNESTIRILLRMINIFYNTLNSVIS